jgi:hypothetical protein
MWQAPSFHALTCRYTYRHHASVPLAVVLVSVIFLKEKVGLRTAAILAGFLGVLLIVRPTPSTFTIYELMALGIVFILAFRDLITKRIPAHIPTFIIALANASFVCLGGIAFGLHQGFQNVALWQFGCFAPPPCFWPRLCSWFRPAPTSWQQPLFPPFAILLGMVIFSAIPYFISSSWR